MALDGMLAEVTQDSVKPLLLKRRPKILDGSDAEQVTLFEATVKVAAADVVALVGEDPTSEDIHRVAVAAITYQTGSEIEYALYPEQQAPGEDGRGWQLHQRYLELLERLKEYLLGTVPGGGASGGDENSLGSLSPRGDFPPPPPDPFAWDDPACGSTW